MPDTTYLLVADSGAARLYQADRRVNTMELIEELDNPAGRKSDRELDTDRPGRRMGTGGGGIHGLNDHDDTKRHEGELFARHLSKLLQERHQAGKFNDLKIAAPPKFLGQLRQELGSECTEVLSFTVDKDLLHSDEADIRSMFQNRT